MISTFFHLLGTVDIEHIIAQLHPKLSGDGVSFPRHQDVQFRRQFDPHWCDFLGNGSYAVGIIPIDPMSEENGGLWVEHEGETIWIVAQPGDIIFLHPHLFHGSGPNRSQRSRKTLLTGFCAFGANHRAYPGSGINRRFTLKENGLIKSTPSPWAQESAIAIDGH